jgi:hypothetical protein
MAWRTKSKKPLTDIQGTVDILIRRRSPNDPW